MLNFKLIEESEEKILYEYYPEGKNDSGVIPYEKKSGKFNIVTVSPTDRHQRYTLKMIKRIKEFAENNAYKKTGIVAWS